MGKLSGMTNKEMFEYHVRINCADELSLDVDKSSDNDNNYVNRNTGIAFAMYNIGYQRALIDSGVINPLAEIAENKEN